MAQLTELKQEHETRRRGRGAAFAVAAVAGTAAVVWFVAGGTSTNSAPPAGVPSPTPSGVASVQVVGQALAPPITAQAPSGWTVVCDCDSLWFNGPDAMSFEVSKPITFALDPATGLAVAAPQDYHQFVVQNRWVEVQNSSNLEVDGMSTTSVTYRVKDSAEPVTTQGKVDLVTDGTADDFRGLTRGATITDVIIPLADNMGATQPGYRLLRFSRAGTAAQQSTIQAAVAEFLASVDLP